MPSNDKPPEHYALCVYGVNHKKYAGKAIIPNSTGAAKAVGLVFQDAVLFPHDEQDVADPQRVLHLRATEESPAYV